MKTALGCLIDTSCRSNKMPERLSSLQWDVSGVAGVPAHTKPSNLLGGAAVKRAAERPPLEW